MGRIVLFFALACSLLHPGFAQKRLQVVTSINPVYLLAHDIAGDKANTILLIPPWQDLHHFSLTPGTLKTLHQADIIFRLSPTVENYLNPLLQQHKEVIDLAAHPAISWLAVSGDHDHHQHHSLAPHPATSWLETHGYHEQATDSHDDDPHLWLNPENALVMARQIATELSEHDPQNRPSYERNLKQLQQRIHTTTRHIKEHLQPGPLSYATFHDGWQYFQQWLGLPPPKTLQRIEGIAAGLKSTLTLKQHLQQNQIHCLLVSPHSSQDIIRTLLEGSKTEKVLLDPKGGDLPDNQQDYPGLLAYTFEQLQHCREDHHAP